MAGAKKRKSTRRSKKGKLVRNLSADEAKTVLDRCVAEDPAFGLLAPRVGRHHQESSKPKAASPSGLSGGFHRQVGPGMEISDRPFAQ